MKASARGSSRAWPRSSSALPRSTAVPGASSRGTCSARIREWCRGLTGKRRALKLNYMVKYQRSHAGPHLRGAFRPDPAGAADAACRRRGRLGERTGAAVLDVAAGGDEAPRRAVRRRTGHAHQDRPHRELPAQGRAPMEEAMHWLNRYQRFWTAQLDRLAAFVEENSWPPTPPSAPPSSPASPSNVVSMPRRRRSSPRGRTRKS